MPTIFKSPLGTGPITGILEFEGDRLVIEYDQPRFLRKTRNANVEIPADEIDELIYQTCISRNSILLRALYRDTVKSIPWSKSLEISFTIPRREKERAMELVDRFEEYVEKSTTDA